MKRTMFAVCLAIFAVGCATMQSVVHSKDQGTARTYAMSKDQAYDAAVRILRSNSGFDHIEQDRASGFVMGAFNSSLGFLGVWVEPTASDTDTKVTAVLKTRTPFPAMTENGFHDRLANAVVKKASP